MISGCCYEGGTDTLRPLLYTCVVFPRRTRFNVTSCDLGLQHVTRIFVPEITTQERGKSAHSFSARVSLLKPGRRTAEMPFEMHEKSKDSAAIFFNALSERPEYFLHPTEGLHASSIVMSKRLMDPVVKASAVLDQIYTENMHVEQIWQQIKLASDALTEKLLEMDLPQHDMDSDLEPDEDADIEEPYQETDPSELSAADDADFDSSGEQYDVMEGGLEDEQRAMYSSAEDLIEDDIEDAGSAHSELDDDEVYDDAPREPFVKDVFGLNEGFFNIDDFNKQTELMDANYAQEQSEDDIDYNADPDEASDVEDLELEDDLENANEVRYDDFFAPPKRQHDRDSTKTKKRARFEEDPLNETEVQRNSEEELEEAGASTIARMQKDLFADDIDEDSENEQNVKLSSHAKRQLKLAQEIRQLENENVSKKDWTLMGEASARARPKDSLLEEGLDFERTSKPVPIVTEETTQSLEQLIKARIVAGQFDTVVRKIPETVHKFTKNSFELDETKPSQSLAEVYETEFQKKQNPGSYQSAQDKRLELDHKEITELYKDLCYNLDSLSNFHYTPKPATESLNIVSNAPAIAMEEAQPLTMSSASRLAPQEQYSASATKGEVVGKSGLPQSKAEMTSEERQRHRRRQRAVAKKSGAQKRDFSATKSRAKQEQAGVISTLKNANVKVIRNGKTKDLKTGRDYNGSTRAVKSANLKL